MSSRSATAASPRAVYPSWIGWTGWGLAALFFFYAWILRVVPSIMVEPVMRDFAVGGAVVGNLSAFYFYSYALLQIPLGMALDQWGPRKTLSAGLVIAALGCVLSALAPTIEVAYAGRLLVGAGAAIGFIGSLVLIGIWFPPHRFALMSGLVLTIGLMGGIFGQGPLAALVDAEGWRFLMYLLAIWGVGHAILTWLFTRDRPQRPIKRASAEASAGKINLKEPFRLLWVVCKRRQTQLIAFASFLFLSPLLAFGGLWGVPFTMARFGIDKPEAGFAVSMALLGVALGGPFWGWLSDRIGRRKLPITLGALLAFVAMSAAIYLPDLSLDVYRILMFLSGIGFGAMSICFAICREHNPGKGSAAALGLVNMFSVLGGALFQPVIGLLLDDQWDGRLINGARIYGLDAYHNALLLLPASFVLSLIGIIFIRETYCRIVGDNGFDESGGSGGASDDRLSAA